MKKKTRNFSLAAAIVGLGLASNASAGVFNVPTNDTKPTTARSLRLQPGGVGHMLVIPYFTAQSGHATLISVTNTDLNYLPTLGGSRAKAVKVRFRGAGNGDSLFDFQVFLSPGDVWTAQVTQGADGRAVLSTTDTSCTLPANVNRSFSVDRLPGDAAAKAAGTLEGYVEIINMADIPSLRVDTPSTGAYGLNTNPLFSAVWALNGVPTCSQAAFAPLDQEAVSLLDLRTKGIDAPTTGLMGSWIIINVPKAAAYSGRADAIVAATETGEAGMGNVVYFPQAAAANVANANPFTADPALRNNQGPSDEHVFASIQPGRTGARTDYAPAGLTLPIVAPAMADFPDLSTPYVESTAEVPVTAVAQAAALSGAMAGADIKNEYLVDPSIAAGTDWVVSLPTRRYSLGIDYRAATPARVFTDLTPTGDTSLTRDYFLTDNTTASLSSASQACVSAPVFPQPFDRQGNRVAPEPQAAWLCGAVNVFTFNPSGGVKVLGSKYGFQGTVPSSLSTLPFTAGWASLPLSGVGSGLPVRGAAFLNAASPANHFGVTLQHGVQRAP